MYRRNAGLAYAGVTSALLVATWFSWHRAGYETLAMWASSCGLLALSQIAFVVIAARLKHYVVLVVAASILLAIVGFVWVLFTMPS